MNKYILKVTQPTTILKKRHSENLELRFNQISISATIATSSILQNHYEITELKHTTEGRQLVISLRDNPQEKLVVRKYNKDGSNTLTVVCYYDIGVQEITAYCSEQTSQQFMDDFQLTVGIEDVVEQYYKRAGFSVRLNSSLTGPSNWSGQTEETTQEREDNLFIHNEDFTDVANWNIKPCKNDNPTGPITRRYGIFRCLKKERPTNHSFLDNRIQISKYDPLVKQAFPSHGVTISHLKLLLINGDYLDIDVAKCTSDSIIVKEGCPVTYVEKRMVGKTFLEQEFSRLNFIPILTEEWGIEFDNSVMRTWS